MTLLSRLIPTSGKVRVGLIIVLVFVLVAIFGPLIAPYGPRQSGPHILEGPSATHWFGTTQLGQDVFSQFVHGARVSLLVGVFAGVLSQTEIKRNRPCMRGKSCDWTAWNRM